SIIYGDTWLWNGTSWSQIATSGPAPRYGNALCYDILGQGTILFGGIVSSYVGDTWELFGNTWTQIDNTGPLARFRNPMVYDSQRGTTVLFGGIGSSMFGDTWERTFTSIASPYGTGCGGLALTSIARPTLNTTAQVGLAGIPSSLAFVSLGWSRTAYGPYTLP